MSRSLNIAHRGGAGLRPENTLAAFAHALDLGVDGFELDVHVAKDGTVVVFHDDALKPEIVRDASGQWIEGPGPLIKDLTFPELQSYDIGRHKPGTKYAARRPDQVAQDGERIPRLAEVIWLINRSGGPERLWVELKTNFADRSRTAAPEAMAKAVMRVLKREKFLERTVLVSFDWPALIAAKKIEPKIECWFTTMPLAELEAPRSAEARSPAWCGGFERAAHGSLAKAAKAAGADGWFPFFADINRASLAEARALGLKVGAWTVNETADLARLADLGVDGLCTDYPDRLSAVLKQG